MYVARNNEFQAVMPVRGKILNIAKSSTDKIEENVEIKNIMSILGIQ